MRRALYKSRWTIFTASCRRRRGHGSKRPAADASHAERHARAVALRQIAIARHRPQRKEFPVSVIAQVEDPRKSGRRKSLFIPETGLCLGLLQILDAPSDRRIVNLAAGHQTEKRPGCLRRGARCWLVAMIVELVARPVFAPAPVWILDRR